MCPSRSVVCAITAGLNSLVDGHPLNQAVHGNDFWQTDYDAAQGRWRLTYNLLRDGQGPEPPGAAPINVSGIALQSPAAFGLVQSSDGWWLQTPMFSPWGAPCRITTSEKSLPLTSLTTRRPLALPRRG